MLLSALVLAAVASSAQALDGYTLMRFTDAANHDLVHLDATIEELAAACTKNSSCAGFNTDGWLKDCVSDSCIQSTTACDLYVKNSDDTLAASLWPLPKHVTGMTGASIPADGTSFTFTASSGSSSPVLTKAFSRYQKIIFNGRLPTPPLGAPAPFVSEEVQGPATGVTVTVKTIEPPLGLGMDEAYTLDVPSAGGEITISANTTWGALRALERLSQVVSYTGTGSAYTFFVGTIDDEPMFSHRGLLVDTSRHFYRVDALYMALDVLAYNFFSVFHWHIVDDQSFPYDSTTFPEMSAKGAYNAPATTHVYSQEDVKNVIAYARDRGIRVLVEFDTPGHTQSWGMAHPELLVPCYSGGQPDGSRYGMNPLLNSTYDFLTSFFKEINEVFPDHYVHVGGDELRLGSGSCWTTNPDLQKWMKEHGQTDYAALENLYEQNLVKIVSGVGKRLIGWQELYDNGIDLPDAFVVNVWKGGWENEMVKVTTAGHDAVLSAPYYENYIDNPYGDAGDWRKYYISPVDWNGTPEQKSHVVGGEVSFWSEYIDAANAIPRAWPRAASPGERFWSQPEVNSTDAAAGRLHGHRCRLVARGIPAEPVEGPSFCVDEYEVGYQPPF